MAPVETGFSRSADAKFLPRAIGVADRVASLMQPEAVPKLQAYLRDGDSGVRYWDAMG